MWMSGAGWNRCLRLGSASSNRDSMRPRHRPVLGLVAVCEQTTMEMAARMVA